MFLRLGGSGVRRQGLQQTIRRPQISVKNLIGDDSLRGVQWQNGSYKLRQQLSQLEEETRTDRLETAETQTKDNRQDIEKSFYIDFDLLIFGSLLT